MGFAFFLTDKSFSTGLNTYAPTLGFSVRCVKNQP
jgi:hypothetical protein